MATPSTDNTEAAVTRHRDALLARCLVAIAMSASIVFAWLSTGAYQLDDLAHLKFAEWAWTHPAYLVHEWGRPGFTLVYAIPAALGWFWARCFTAILCATTAWFTFRIARRASVARPWLCVALLFLQPLFFVLSYCTLTETVLALILAVAVDLAQRNRWSWSAFVLAIALVTRLEAVLFVPIWAWAAWRQRASVWRLWPIGWAWLAQHLLISLGTSESVWQRWTNLRPTDYYGSGGWLSMWCRSFEAWGPGLAALAFCGALVLMLRRDPRQTAALLIAGPMLSYFVVHTIIWRFGLFGGGGLPRYLVPIAPFIAISATESINALLASGSQLRRLVCLGVAALAALMLVATEIQMRTALVPFYVPYSHFIQWFIRVFAPIALLLGVIGWMQRATLPARRAGSLAVSTILLAALAGVQLAVWGYIVEPVRPLPQERVAAATLDWLRRQGLADRPMIYADLCIAAARGETFPAAPRRLRDAIGRAEPGTLVVWDYFYAEQPWNGIVRSDMDGSPSFRLLYTSPPVEFHPEAEIRVYEKIAEWTPRARS